MFWKDLQYLVLHAFFVFLVHFMMERVQKLSGFKCFSTNLLCFNQRVMQLKTVVSVLFSLWKPFIENA
jgi:hypothetical protein